MVEIGATKTSFLVYCYVQRLQSSAINKTLNTNDYQIPEVHKKLLRYLASLATLPMVLVSSVSRVQSVLLVFYLSKHLAIKPMLLYQPSNASYLQLALKL